MRGWSDPCNFRCWTVRSDFNWPHQHKSPWHTDQRPTNSNLRKWTVTASFPVMHFLGRCSVLRRCWAEWCQCLTKRWRTRGDDGAFVEGLFWEVRKVKIEPVILIYYYTSIRLKDTWLKRSYNCVENERADFVLVQTWRIKNDFFPCCAKSERRANQLTKSHRLLGGLISLYVDPCEG